MGMEARSSAAFNIMSLFFTCGSKNDLPHLRAQTGSTLQPWCLQCTGNLEQTTALVEASNN